MASLRQLAANRKNASKSTGPKSKAGKQQSRNNALRHGLAIPVGADQALREDIEEIERIITGGKEPGSLARVAAEAATDLIRIGKVQTEVYRELSSASLTFARRSELDLVLARLQRYRTRAISRQKRAFRDL